MSPLASSGLKNKLVLIDGHAIMHRAYHAMPKLTTRKGEPIGAVQGFTNIVLKIINDLKPTHLAVCFDRKEPTFRKIEFEDYQAHRPETDKDLSSQFEKAQRVVKAFGIPVYEKKGYEADDLIGTIARRSTESKRVKEYKSKSKKKSEKAVVRSQLAVDEVIIVTGDKDILQLVNDKVKVYLPIKGLSVAKMMGRRDVYEKLGVNPSQIVDYKALVGDPSDNYKGVPQIGPKTAEHLLEKYKTFDNIYENMDKIPARIAKKLKEGKKSGEMSYKLAQIITDVSLKFDIDETCKWGLDKKEVIDVFDEFGFRSLKNRIQKRIAGDIDKKPSKENIKKVVKMLAKILGKRQYAIRGTISLILQGYDMGVDDIDVLCDRSTATTCNKLLKEYLLEEVKYRQSDQYKSYYGKFVIDKILVEVYGDWQIRVKPARNATHSVAGGGRESERVKGKWSGIFNASKDEINQTIVDGLKVNVTKPDDELSVFALEGRWNAYHKLRKQIESKNQRKLF